MVNKEKLVDRIQKRLKKAYEMRAIKKEIKEYYSDYYKSTPVINSKNIDLFDNVTVKDIKMLHVFTNENVTSILRLPVAERKDKIKKIEEYIYYSRRNTFDITELRALGALLKRKDTTIIVNPDKTNEMSDYFITNDKYSLRDGELNLRYIDNNGKFIGLGNVYSQKSISVYLNSYFWFDNKRYAFRKFIIKDNQFTGVKFNPHILDNVLFRKVCCLPEVTNTPDFVKDYLLLA